MTKLHVGNLPDKLEINTLRDLFKSYGGGASDVNIIQNYAFVTMPSSQACQEAIKGVDKTKLFGKTLSVQMSKNQKSGGGRDNKKDGGNNRRDGGGANNRRSGPYNRNNDDRRNKGPMVDPQLQQLGGILGAAPLILNEMAKAGQQLQQQDNNKPDPDIRVRREVVHVRNVPGADKYGFDSGYVIHERYYVLPSHPLLNGLNVAQLPTLGQTNCARTR